MEIIPVLDLLDGIVVRGVGGRRHEYRPLVSRLTNEVQPLAVARALRRATGASSLYVADLDAIVHQSPNHSVYEELREDGFTLRIDAGLSTPTAAHALQQRGYEPIIGLETCPGPRDLASIVEACGGDLTFSLDLQAGRPLHRLPAPEWSPSPLEVAQQALDVGVSRLLLLDLADVGEMCGSRTLPLCRTLHTLAPDVALTGGGGVRTRHDVKLWEHAGAAGLLVASALHAGTIGLWDP